MTGPKPGSPEWLKYMTASKIAAVVGTSPYESRFSLWHRMHGDLGPQDEKPEMEYGKYIEPALLAWFADKHPEFTVTRGQWFTSGRFGATPDGLFWAEMGAGASRFRGLVECKTGRLSYEWADGVPPGYYDQTQWSLHVAGEDVAYVVADVAMEFREYRIDYDAERIAFLEHEADLFMESLDEHRPPALDGSAHTYQAIRQLHPDVDPESVDVPDELAVRWLDARERVTEATDAEQLAKNEIADLMGNAQRAVWNDITLLTRQARGGGTPFLKAASGLPSARKAA